MSAALFIRSALECFLIHPFKLIFTIGRICYTMWAAANTHTDNTVSGTFQDSMSSPVEAGNQCRNVWITGQPASTLQEEEKLSYTCRQQHKALRYRIYFSFCCISGINECPQHPKCSSGMFCSGTYFDLII